MTTNIAPGLQNQNNLQSKQKLWNIAAAFIVSVCVIITVLSLFFPFSQNLCSTSISTKNNITIHQLGPPKNNTKQKTVNGTIGVNTRNQTFPTKENLCTSDHCLQAVSNLKFYMNESCDPCEDFYTYACGGWIKEQEKKLKNLNLTHISIFKQMELENQKIIRNLLENIDPNVSSYDAEKKAKTFYASCVNENPVDTDCTVETMDFFPEVTSKLFVEHEFLSQRDSLNNLIHNITISFQTILSQFYWMDNGTRQTIQSHVDNMIENSGYVEEIMNTTSTDEIYKEVKMYFSNYYRNKLGLGKFRDDYSRETTKAATFHSMMPYEYNEQITYIRDMIFIAAVLARRPKFDQTYANVLNFGGIGTIVGHELGHIFVTYFSQVLEPIPLKTVDVAETMISFIHGNKCFEEYFSNRTWVHMQSGEKIKVNGSLTLDENIADSLGLQIAFKSFLEFGGIYAPLAGLKKFSKEQVFFIASAQGWCEAFVDRAAAKQRFDYQAMNDVHSPDFVRVMGSFANSPDFSKAFNCPVGSAYNPQDKCLINDY